MVEESSLSTALQLTLGAQVTSWRSLVSHLVTQGVIEQMVSTQGRVLSLSLKGMRLCDEHFPALSADWQQWNGEWLNLVFIRPPKTDLQFRYLRSFLLQLKALPVSRGNYLVPILYQPELLRLIQSSYENSVVIFRAGEWSHGSIRQLTASYFQFADQLAALSGISKEIESLLIEISKDRGRQNQHKQRFATVFNRFWDVLGDDPGFLNHFVPTAPAARSLLTKLQSVFDAFDW